MFKEVVMFHKLVGDFGGYVTQKNNLITHTIVL